MQCFGCWCPRSGRRGETGLRFHTPIGRNIKGPSDLCNGAPIADRVQLGPLVTFKWGNRGLRMVTEQSASKLPEIRFGRGGKWRRRPTRVCHEAREMHRPVLDIDPVRSTRHPFSLLFIYLLSSPRPPITLSCPAAPLIRAGHAPTALSRSPLCYRSDFPPSFFFFSLTSQPLYTTQHVHSRTQAGPATPRSPSCLRPYSFLCPSISPPTSGPITSSIPSITFLSHAPKSVDCATVRRVSP